MKQSAALIDDHTLLRKTTRSVAWQTAVAVTLVLVVVAFVAYFAYGRERDEHAQALAREVAMSADDVADPAPGAIIIEQSADGTLFYSKGTPAAVRDYPLTSLPPGSSQITIAGIDYAAFGAAGTGSDRFIALVAETAPLETGRLLLAVGAAAIAGIIGAAVVGAFIGRRAARPLAQSLAMQRRFVADASHELRAPLSVLHTRAQLIERRAAGTGDTELQSELEQLLADSRALNDVVDDLLLSAELANNVNRRDTVDLNAVVQAAVDRYRIAATQRQVGLEANLAESPVIVAGIVSSIERAVAALVDNALSHERPGGTVTVATCLSDDNAELAVSDTGEGIRPGDEGGLTQRFARGDNAESDGHRVGLGLALVKEVIQAHSGELRIESDPGQGATFTLILPRTRR